MEFLITWALILGLLVVPGLVNYYVNRYFSPPGTIVAPPIELIVASLALAFAVLVAAMLVALVVALGWEDLKDEITAFVQLGLIGYGQERPIALTGFLSAWSVASMGLMGLLGSLRIPARFVR